MDYAMPFALMVSQQVDASQAVSSARAAVSPPYPVTSDAATIK